MEVKNSKVTPPDQRTQSSIPADKNGIEGHDQAALDATLSFFLPGPRPWSWIINIMKVRGEIQQTSSVQYVMEFDH
jgi:hypothetical protein